MQNVDEGSVTTAALGFECDLLAAPQARGSPIGFGSAFGRNYERVNGLAHGLRCGVAEHALELAVDALGAEGGIEDNESVGRTLELLFEILTAKVEYFFSAFLRRSVFPGILFRVFGGPGFCGIPVKRRRLGGRVGIGRRNERGRGSALECAAQTFGAYKFPRLRCPGDTTTHFGCSPQKLNQRHVRTRGNHSKVTEVI